MPINSPLDRRGSPPPGQVRAERGPYIPLKGKAHPARLNHGKGNRRFWAVCPARTSGTSSSRTIFSRAGKRESASLYSLNSEERLLDNSLSVLPEYVPVRPGSQDSSQGEKNDPDEVFQLYKTRRSRDEGEGKIDR